MASKSETIMRVASLCGRVESLECNVRHAKNLEESGALERIHEAKDALLEALSTLESVS